MAEPATTSFDDDGIPPRRRFEEHYRDALESHFRTPTEQGLADAQALGRQAISDGVSVLDVVRVHMEARRGLFPDVAPQFADVDAFLGAALSAFQSLADELQAAHRLADAEARRIEVLRRMRDVAVDLSRATTRRSVAMVMLQAAMELSGARAGTVAVFRGRAGRRDRRPDLLASMPSRDARRTRALSAAAHAIDGLLEAHAALDLPSLEEVRSAIGDSPSDVLDAKAVAAYPIVWRGRVRGALIIAAPEEDAFDWVDRELINSVVIIGSPALERAGRYDVDHEIALKLQRGMLSTPPCDVPEVRWSTHYSSAATGLVGGDWFDVINLRDRIGFAIGDIVGRGINAAVAMGQVRSASRALANCFDKPHEVVEALDHFASSTGCGEDSSMAYVTINRHSGEIAYAVAGHPPPLVILPDGTEWWLDGASSSLLGRGGSRPTASLSVDPGTTIVLYTDGLVERRGESLDVGLARLVDAVRAMTGEDDSAERLVAKIGSAGGVDDDVAVVMSNYLGG